MQPHQNWSQYSLPAKFADHPQLSPCLATMFYLPFTVFLLSGSPSAGFPISVLVVGGALPTHWGEQLVQEMGSNHQLVGGAVYISSCQHTDIRVFQIVLRCGGWEVSVGWWKPETVILTIKTFFKAKTTFCRC